jgi:hypothetical protein
MKKTPFMLNARPLKEPSTAHAGVLAHSRAFRSLEIPELIKQHIHIRKRERGFSESQMIESIVLLQTLGGDCPEDISLLCDDECLARGLGYESPRVTAVRDFLEAFHDEGAEQLRPSREDQRSFIFPETTDLKGLQAVQAGCVARIAEVYEQRGAAHHIATIDEDATIIESHKASAYAHYKGGRGYQPVVAVWAEADLVVADEFRDGNVPAGQEPLNCCTRAFDALPSSVSERYFRGDSACYEQQLLQWLNSADREEEPGGRIGFAISADMSRELRTAMLAVDDSEWQTITREADGTLRQWAEVEFVPSQRSENKNSVPLRYLGLRILKPQGLLFADGSDREHFAVVTNLDWEGARLLQWHREKAGTIEHVHDEVKNALGGGHMPSQKIGANAAWFRCALLSYNVISAIKALCFTPEERTARLKRYRLLLVHVAGRMNRNNCVMTLRLCASVQTIERMQMVWEVFTLPTQATASKPFRKSA